MSKLLSIIKTKGCPNCHMDKHARELEQAIKDWVRGLVGEKLTGSAFDTNEHTRGYNQALDTILRRLEEEK